jgi:hypothetical protein
MCPHWTKGEIKSIEDAGCELKMECPKSHGWLESKYHPDLRKREIGSASSSESEQNKTTTSNKNKDKDSNVQSI